jgi:predicted dehydrogenase
VEAENGLGSIVASCNSPIHGDTFDILGSKIALRGDLWGRTLITFRPRTQSSMSVGMSNLHLSLQLFKVIGSTALTLLKSFRGTVSAHYTFISRFIDSILNEGEPPTTAEDGRETVKTVETICEQIK